jgi:nucleoside-diphosphate-sugar epimerase
MVEMNRETEERAGTFGPKIRELKPDIVIDMICFTEESARHIVEALRDQVRHFLHCSTVWVHGKVVQVPVSEDQTRRPVDDYGTKKAAIEAYLHEEARRRGFPVACVLPGHIVGEGWTPLNPQGNFNLEVFTRLARGEEVILPDTGSGVLHHVHADDVAQVFMNALAYWNNACGESFHTVSPAALTMGGYAEAVAGWYGQPARLAFLPFPEWSKTVPQADADDTRWHLDHNPNCYSIAKAQRLLNYQPRYSSLSYQRTVTGWFGIGQSSFKPAQAPIWSIDALDYRYTSFYLGWGIDFRHILPSGWSIKKWLYYPWNCHRTEKSAACCL